MTKQKNAIIFTVALLLSGCLIHSDIILINDTTIPQGDISGEYITKENKIYNIYSLGDNSFQYKGEKRNIKSDVEWAKKSIATMEEGCRDNKNNTLTDEQRRAQNEVCNGAGPNSLKRIKLAINEWIEKGKRGENIQENAIFKTEKLGSGWIVLQITKRISIQEGFLDIFPSRPDEKDIILISAIGSEIKVYRTEVCMDANLASKYGVTIKKSEKTITDVKTSSSFRNFMIACVNEKKLELTDTFRKLN